MEELRQIALDLLGWCDDAEQARIEEHGGGVGAYEAHAREIKRIRDRIVSIT